MSEVSWACLLLSERIVCDVDRHQVIGLLEQSATLSTIAQGLQIGDFTSARLAATELAASNN